LDKLEIKLNHDKVDQIYYQEIWGFRTDERFHFFYDESNNCRKFWIKPKEENGQFNSNINEDFVLAGIAYEGDDFQVDFENIKDMLGLQKNVKEIKFKSQFSENSFLDCMKKKRLTTLFQWIDENNLFIHYSHVNNLYYALVEIIDSITDPSEIEEYDFNYFSIKSTFYRMLKKKEVHLQKVMFDYCFPNIKNEDIKGFCDGLLNLFENRYNQSIEEKFITGMIERASKSDSLIFIQDNEDYIMQANYVEFYINPISTYENSVHIFDEELEIQKYFDECNFVRNGLEIDCFKFVNSKDDVLVQVSDVVAGIFGKLFSYINSNDLKDIRSNVSELDQTQITNILMINKLRYKSDKRNRGFLHSLAPLHETNMLNTFFDLAHARKLEIFKFKVL